MARRALPFIPIIKAGLDEAEQAAAQLNALIEKQEAGGWQFSHLDGLTTWANAGCLSSNKTGLRTFQLAIFERSDV
jgi:hypothetical protein